MANLPYSPNIGENSDCDIFDFRISGQSLLKKICHNFRSNDNNAMKFGPVNKIDMRNKTTSKKLVDEAMSEDSDSIVVFLICQQFGAI